MIWPNIKIEDLRGSTVHSKQIKIPAGQIVRQHFHAFDHVSILAFGSVELRRDGKPEFLTGPVHVIIPAGVTHEIRAITNAVWYCTHSAGSPDSHNSDFEV